MRPRCVLFICKLSGGFHNAALVKKHCLKSTPLYFSHSLLLTAIFKTSGLKGPDDAGCLFPTMRVYFCQKEHGWKSQDGEVPIQTPDFQQQSTTCVKCFDTHLYIKFSKKKRTSLMRLASGVAIGTLFKMSGKTCNNSLSRYMVKEGNGKCIDKPS